MSTSVPQTMRAVVLQGPGDTGAFQVHQVPVPQPEPGCVLIRVRAAGLNRSELHIRLGLAEGASPASPGCSATRGSSTILPDRLPAQRDRLTAYSGEATDLLAAVLQDYLAAAALDPRLIPLDRVFTLDEIADAHEHMDQNRATGKIVVTP